ncbi:mechanosensitive ion channel family protein [Desulfopila sp. IMCC35008]|uniref:mechanosensitive ion channel family protein n=1 Tax=Desulfopila sp. IMCC35008 TaxID=2653858 RepID=UPI00197AA742|nr:mechanosensitive ion channel family protein [Desulfopila sp. IMCC35008]
MKNKQFLPTAGPAFFCLQRFLWGDIAHGAVDNSNEAAIPVMETLQPVVDLFQGNPWLQGISVILVTFTLASLGTWILFRIVRRLTVKTRMELDDQVASLLRPPVYYILVASGFFYGIYLLPLTDNLEIMAKRSVQTAGVIVWVLFFNRLAHLLLERFSALTDRYTFLQQRTLTLFDNGAKIVIFFAGIHAIFLIWNINMTAWLASAGIVGIAVGFAAKDTLSNLFSGVFILADAPYKVGDYIVLDNTDRGQVTHIGLRSTRILTRDDVEVTVPNSLIGNARIINQSGGPHERLRIRLKVSVAYGTDIDKMRKVLMDIATSEPLVCQSPAPRIRFRVLAPSSLDFELLCWAPNPALRGRTMDSLNEQVYKRFMEEGIEIPFQTQDVYIKALPENATTP